MSFAIDAIAIFGALLICAGVFILFGAGYSMISAGILTIAFALKAAKVQEGANVSHD